MDSEKCRMFDDYLSGKINDTEKFRKHTESCPVCSGKLEKLESLDSVIKGSLNEFEFKSLNDEIVKKALETKRSGSLKSFLSRKVYAFGAAAAILIIAFVCIFKALPSRGGNGVPAATPKGTFEIYLVNENLGSINDINSVTYDGEPVVTMDDIDYCIWDDNIKINAPVFEGKNLLSLQLKEDANIFKRVNERKKIGTSYIPFVAVCGGERIFMGAFYSALSSVSPPENMPVLCEVTGYNGQYIFVETDSKNLIHSKKLYDAMKPLISESQPEQQAINVIREYKCQLFKIAANESYSDVVKNYQGDKLYNFRDYFTDSGYNTFIAYRVLSMYCLSAHNFNIKDMELQSLSAQKVSENAKENTMSFRCKTEIKVTLNGDGKTELQEESSSINLIKENGTWKILSEDIYSHPEFYIKMYNRK